MRVWLYYRLSRDEDEELNSLRNQRSMIEAYALSNGSMILPHRPAGTTVSIFCHGATAEGVSIRGLYYPLDGYTLTCDHPLGVSNQHTQEEAEISVQNGTLLIIQHLQKES